MSETKIAVPPVPGVSLWLKKHLWVASKRRQNHAEVDEFECVSCNNIISLDFRRLPTKAQRRDLAAFLPARRAIEFHVTAEMRVKMPSPRALLKRPICSSHGACAAGRCQELVRDALLVDLVPGDRRVDPEERGVRAVVDVDSGERGVVEGHGAEGTVHGDVAELAAGVGGAEGVEQFSRSRGRWSPASCRD